MAITDCGLGFYQLFFSIINVLKRLNGFEIVFHIMIWEGRKIDLETDFTI